MMVPVTEYSPVYLRLVARMVDGILAGTYLEGRLLPSTSRLGEEFGANPATIARAVNVLVAAEVLEKVRGTGTVVAMGAGALVKRRRLESFSARHLEPTIAEAKLLGISLQRLSAMVIAQPSTPDICGSGSRSTFRQHSRVETPRGNVTLRT